MASERVVRAVVWAAVLWAASTARLLVVRQDVGDDARAWNDLTLLSARPTAAEIEAHKCTAPDQERQRASRAVAAALVKEAVPDGLADHLLALGDWDGQDVFFVLYRHGQYIIELIDTAAELSVRVSGSGDHSEENDGAKRALAERLAAELLAPALRPSASSQRHDQVREGRVSSTWRATDPVDLGAGAEIADGHYHTDGETGCFELRKLAVGSAAMFPPPYVFAPPDRPVVTPRPLWLAHRTRFLDPAAHPLMEDWVESVAVTLEQEYIDAHLVDVPDDARLQAFRCARAAVRPEWLPDTWEEVPFIDKWPPPHPGYPTANPPLPVPVPVAYEKGEARCLLFEHPTELSLLVEFPSEKTEPERLRLRAGELMDRILVDELKLEPRHISYERAGDVVTASCMIPEGEARAFATYLYFWYDGSALALLIGKPLTNP